MTSIVLLALLAALNIVGLGVGKWINNLGAIGTFIAATVLIVLGSSIWPRFGITVTAADFRIPPDPRFVLNSFGVICFALVGLELASVMGDEIQDPQRTLPGAVAWGGLISGALYIGATLTLLIAIGKNDISVLQGIVQAVAKWRARSAWPGSSLLSRLCSASPSRASGRPGSAALRAFPFVAGLDSYMPEWLGKVHPNMRRPHAALIVHVAVSLVSVVMCFFASGGVQEAFQTMLSLAVVLQLVPFLYVFAALLKFAFKADLADGRYGRGTLMLRGPQRPGDHDPGNCAGIFSAAAIVSSLRTYELKMVAAHCFFISLRIFFQFTAANKVP